MALVAWTFFRPDTGGREVPLSYVVQQAHAGNVSRIEVVDDRLAEVEQTIAREGLAPKDDAPGPLLAFAAWGDVPLCLDLHRPGVLARELGIVLYRSSPGLAMARHAFLGFFAAADNGEQYGNTRKRILALFVLVRIQAGPLRINAKCSILDDKGQSRRFFGFEHWALGIPHWALIECHPTSSGL